MSFFNILEYTKYNQGYAPIPLKIVQSKGIEVSPDLNIEITNLNKDISSNILYKHFFNQGYGGITFKIEVIIHKDERHGEESGPLVIDVLSNIISNMIPVMVITDAIDVPDGAYIIKGNSSRKQDFKEYTVWTLEFITYNSLNSVKYTNNNAEVQKSLKNYQIAKKKAVAKSKATTKSKLSKCKLTYLKYSSKKKKIACVKYMQLILYKKGYLTKSQVDGWFGKKTTLALKKFQKKYKKKYKLKVTGKVDKATLNALVKA